MSITKNTIRKLEKRFFLESEYIIIPINSSTEEAEAIRQEAKRQGKRTRGIPLEDVKKVQP